MLDRLLAMSTTRQDILAVLASAGELIVSRTPATFKQADLVRAVKAAQAAGLVVAAIKIKPDGTIELIHSCSIIGPENDYDRLEADL
jgi:hypothetical protein